MLRYAQTRGLDEPHRIDRKATKSRKLQNFYSVDEVVQLDAAAAAFAAENPHRIHVFGANAERNR
jgi:hypothetical protein